jgi:hypothetical protein
VFDVRFAEPATSQLGKRPAAEAWVNIHAALSLLWFRFWFRHDDYLTVFARSWQPAANDLGGIRA